MEFIRGINNIRPKHFGSVLTIGKFDGVHLGHQYVLKHLLEKAHALNLPASAMIFEPQPEEYFAPEHAPARLSHWREKYHYFESLGLQRLLCIRFNQAFASQSPETFIQHVLVEKLGVKYLVVGDDFRFGQQRKGDFAMLVEAGKRHGFEVVSMQSFKVEQARVSSSAIRQFIANSQFDQAQCMLGRPYAILGKVAHGQKKGRTIGYPTINLSLKGRKCALKGVFLNKVHTSYGTFWGMGNVGTRPTLNGSEQRLEVHLFDFNGDLYGQSVEVEFLHKLRDEERFSSFEALQQQIRVDEQLALTLIKKQSAN